VKAIDVTGQSPSGGRQKLQDLLPLDTPFVIQVFPIYACNLKCNYCIFQKPLYKRHFITDTALMPTDNFYEYVRQMQAFPRKIKVLRFVGIGEPLLHPELSNMIAYAKRKNIAEKIEVITNGLALNPDLSDELINAGLDSLEVSVQGLSCDDYFNNTKTPILFDLFLYQLSYFYHHKKDCKVYIKIVDSVLTDKDKFFKTFGHLCDYIGVENTVPIHTGVELPERVQTQFGKPLVKSDVCSQPFYHIQINPDGIVVPCYSFEFPYVLGNANKSSLVDIWNGEALKTFRLNHTDNEICKACKMSKYRMFEEDKIEIEKVRELYNE
jgi:radical SAM protein with 4Fe4S-binding SPASM domain